MNVPSVNFTPISNNYATVNVRSVDVLMKTGYVFYDLTDYEGLTDENGNPREPYPEEISYSRAIYNVPVNYDFSNIVIVPEADVPSEQMR